MTQNLEFLVIQAGAKTGDDTGESLRQASRAIQDGGGMVLAFADINDVEVLEPGSVPITTLL